MIELSSHLARCLGNGDDPFDAVLRLEGEVVREHKHRRTFRVELDGRAYFVKIHGNTSSIEILKHAALVRWPVLTAQNERDAIRHLDALGVPTTRIAGYGCRGTSPARLESFIITDALDETIALDELTTHWGGLNGRDRVRLRRTLVRKVAAIARNLHKNGLNHRDFYLCHFLVPDRDWTTWRPDDPLDVHVIDLHRAQMRSFVPKRWVVKDLGGLLFSSLDAGLTGRDYLRFISEYFGRPWRQMIVDRPRFFRRIVRRAVKVYRSVHGTDPQLPASLASFA